MPKLSVKAAAEAVLAFPEVLYVVREADSDTHYFVAAEDLDGIDPETIVAIYGRQTVRRLVRPMSYLAELL